MAQLAVAREDGAAHLHDDAPGARRRGSRARGRRHVRTAAGAGVGLVERVDDLAQQHVDALAGGAGRAHDLTAAAAQRGLDGVELAALRHQIHLVERDDLDLLEQPRLEGLELRADRVVVLDQIALLEQRRARRRAGARSRACARCDAGSGRRGRRPRSRPRSGRECPRPRSGARRRPRPRAAGPAS